MSEESNQNANQNDPPKLHFDEQAQKLGDKILEPWQVETLKALQLQREQSKAKHSPSRPVDDNANVDYDNSTSPPPKGQIFTRTTPTSYRSPAYDSPRRDLQESYCRRYESYIARALKEPSFIIDPRFDMDLRMKATTFVARFSDAKLGFSRYRYSSSLFDPSTNLSHITVSSLPDGTVRITNRELSRLYAPSGISSASSTDDRIFSQLNPIPAADRSLLHAVCYLLHHNQISCRVKISYSTNEELEYILSLDHETPDHQYYNIVIREPDLHNKLVTLLS